MRLFCLLFLSGVSVAWAQPRPELVRMVAAHPALVAAPAPTLARLHQLTTGTTRDASRPLPTGYSLTTSRALITSAGDGLAIGRAKNFVSGMFVSFAVTPTYHEYNEVYEGGMSIHALGGLVLLETQSPRGRMELTGVSVEGELFPLAVGKTMKVRISQTFHLKDKAIPNVTESDLRVLGRQERLEAGGVEFAGTFFKIEQNTKRTTSTLNSVSESSAVVYYSETYKWVVASEGGTSSSRTGSGQYASNIASSSAPSTPVLVLDGDAQTALKDEVERLEKELEAVHRATAQSYLGPKRAELAMLVPNSGASANTQSSSSSNCAGDTAAQAMQRALVTLGLNRIAERNSNLYIRSGAGVGARLAGNC